MTDLIKIQEKDGQQLVSARDLYTFLEATERFNSWADRNLKYGFVAGRDYSPLTSLHTQNKVEMQDYALTLDTAKQIAMMSRSDRGLQVREYFIECEKKLTAIQAPAIPTTLKGALQFALQQLEEKEAAEEAQKLAEAEAQKQKSIAQELAPAAEYTKIVLTSTSTFRTTQIALELNMSAIKLNTILQEKGIQHKVNKQWCLNAKYLNKGYTDTSTFSYLRSDESTGTSLSMLWTEVGRKFIHDLLNPNLSKSLKPIDE